MTTAPPDPPKWDAFISHASEDKESFVRPLAHALTALGAQVWYDEFTLRLGSSLSASIDSGLAASRYGIVVLSKAFFEKAWPQRELQGLVAREIGGRSTIIPIWYGVTREDVLDFSPTLADKLAANTAINTADEIALQILYEIRPDIAGSRPYDDLRKIATGEAITELQEEIDRMQAELEEFQCPHCGSLLVESQNVPLDPREKDWGMLRAFECGFVELDGYVRRPCPSDPNFPRLEDYEIKFQEMPDDPSWKWACLALPKTDMARKLSLDVGYGRDQQEAHQRVIDRYRQAAKHC